MNDTVQVSKDKDDLIIQSRDARPAQVRVKLSNGTYYPTAQGQVVGQGAEGLRLRFEPDSKAQLEALSSRGRWVVVHL